MSDAAAAVKGTSNNKHEKAHHNSMAERHECPPLNDLSRNRERRTTFLGAERAVCNNVHRKQEEDNLHREFLYSDYLR
jgi:hypothetical protein